MHDFESLQDKFYQSALKKDLQDLTNLIMPMVTDITLRIANFKKDQQTNCEIIRRYDEVLTEKASKFNILELKNELEIFYAKTF